MKVMVMDNCGDDAECGAGGTIARMTKNGTEVIIGRFNPINETNTKAARLLGAKEVHMGFPEFTPETRVDTPENSKKVNDIIMRYKPDIIFAYWPVDEHPGHRAVSTMAIRCVNGYYQEAVDSKGGFHGDKYCPELCFFEVLTGKQTKCFHPDVYIDISGTFALKKQAMQLYDIGDTYFKQWYVHQVQIAEFRGKENGAIRHGQIDRGLYAEAFISFPMPPCKKRISLSEII